MRIETLKSLIGAKPLNTAWVSSIENIVFDVKKIKRGDLFFAYDEHDIAKAVEKGAYCIIIQTPVRVLDDEIAWLRVDSLENATIKLLRYYLEFHQKKIILLPNYEYEILKNSIISHTACFLQNDYKSLFSLFYKENKIFFSNDKDFVESFTKEYEMIFLQNSTTPRITNNNFFQTSFIYNDTFYKNILLCPVFLQNLTNTIDIALKYELEINLNKLEFSEFFYPQFFTKRLKKTDFGKGVKVIIFSKNTDALKLAVDKSCKHLKVSLYEGKDANKLYELIRSNDYVIASHLKKAVLELPPFFQEEKENLLF